MTTKNGITITPVFWQENHYTIKWHYLSPEGTLWNVSGVSSNGVSVWTINAWGKTIYQGVNLYEFKSTWKEYGHED